MARVKHADEPATNYYFIEQGRFQSGQMGRTVNPLSFDFRGSNPLLPTPSQKFNMLAF